MQMWQARWQHEKQNAGATCRGSMHYAACGHADATCRCSSVQESEREREGENGRTSDRAGENGSRSGASRSRARGGGRWAVAVELLEQFGHLSSRGPRWAA